MSENEQDPVAWKFTTVGGSISFHKADPTCIARDCDTLTPLYTHPAPPSRDKVEGLVKQINWICSHSEHDAPRVERGLLYRIRDLLAALSTTKEDGRG